MKSRRVRTGQHFLSSADAAERVVSAAQIAPTDKVLEAGTGTGALVRLVCARASHVTSVELDEGLHRGALANLGDIPNLELVCGDAFEMDTECDVFVSSLPYSQSRRALEWMAQQNFARGALIVQKEFAAKLSPPQQSQRRAISVIAHATFEIEHISNVSRRSFSPPPHVDSVILALRRRRTLDAATVRAINSLFSYRRKTLQGALRRLGIGTESYGNQRLEELDGDEIVRIAEKVGS